MEGEQRVMHQSFEKEYVTSNMCELHHKIMEGQIELLKQKDSALEEKIGGIEKKLEAMEDKIDRIIEWQANQYKIQLGIAIIVAFTLAGVLLGRGIDFGLFL
jgi:hydroxymethylglutaryl-CoA reductase